MPAPKSKYWIDNSKALAEIVRAINCEMRVFRGGAWTNPPKDRRSANRAYTSHLIRSYDLGFRVGRTLEP